MDRSTPLPVAFEVEQIIEDVGKEAVSTSMFSLRSILVLLIMI